MVAECMEASATVERFRARLGIKVGLYKTSATKYNEQCYLKTKIPNTQ